MAITSQLKTLRDKPRWLPSHWAFYGGIFVLLLVWTVCLGPKGSSLRMARQGAVMLCTRTLALAMAQYATDHGGKYPSGASSTEVFQKLMDGNYVADPGVFFVPLPGKVPGKSGERLRPENIAYDVTSGIDANSPENVPVVFLTGFRMSYVADAPVISLVKPFPSTVFDWSVFFSNWASSSITFDGLPIAYKSNNAFFRTDRAPNGVTSFTPDGYGIVPNVIVPDFDSRGQNYHQLTPDGVLK